MALSRDAQQSCLVTQRPQPRFPGLVSRKTGSWNSPAGVLGRHLGEPATVYGVRGKRRWGETKRDVISNTPTIHPFPISKLLSLSLLVHAFYTLVSCGSRWALNPILRNPARYRLPLHRLPVTRLVRCLFPAPGAPRHHLATSCQLDPDHYVSHRRGVTCVCIARVVCVRDPNLASQG